MSKQTRKPKTSAKPSKKVKEDTMFSLREAADPQIIKVKLKDIDADNGFKFRWTRVAASRAEATGKFVRVGVKPENLKEDAKTINPPFVSVTKLDKYMVEGEESYDAKNLIITTLPLGQLGDAFEDKYKDGWEEDWKMPIFILGTYDNIVKQLKIQNVLPADFDKKGKEGEWLVQFTHDVDDYEKWTKSKEYEKILETYESTKKTKVALDTVDDEIVLKVLALSKAFGKQKVKVLDVNGVEVAKFGEIPTKSITNVFTEQLLEFLERVKEDDTETYADTHVIDISGLAVPHMEKVKIIEKPKTAEGGHRVLVGGFEQFKLKKGKESFDISDLVYSKNSKAVKVLLEEIAAVNKGGLGFKYTGLTREDKMAANFESKLSQIQSEKLSKKKAPKNDAMSYR
jgi:hypothetical protein